MKPSAATFAVSLLAMLPASSAQSQGAAWPAGPVKFITSVAAGTATDPAMRIIIDELGKAWGQPTLLINQPGAGGAIAARAAASAGSDGYTLFMAVASIFTVLPELQPDLAIKISELVPIGLGGEAVLTIATTSSLRVNSLSQLFELSRQQEGGLTVAAAFRGSTPHLTLELLQKRSGAPFTKFFHTTRAAGVAEVIAGRVPVIVDGLIGGTGDETLKRLAVTSKGRLPSHPNVPTVAETLPGFVSTGWFAVMAPSGTPPAVASKIGADLRNAIAKAQVGQRLQDIGVSTRLMSPSELADFIRSEQQVWTPVVRSLGLDQKK